MLKIEGGAPSAVVKSIRSAWGKFRELEPLILVRDISLRLKCSIYMYSVLEQQCCMGVKHGV